MMKSERSDTEKNNQIEEGKGIGIDKVIKHNVVINKDSKLQNNTIILFKV